MAGVSAWLATAIALLPPMLLAVIAAGRGAAAGRLVAVQLASSVVVLLAIVLTFVADQPSSTDLTLAFALLSLPATLLFALFQERWT